MPGGFRLPVRSVTLVFEDGDYLGLEVEVRTNVGMDFYFDTLEWQELKTEPAEVREFARGWAAEVLVGWNLEDARGKPVPHTPEQFTARFEPYAIGLVIGKWLEAMGTVAAPLSSASAKAPTSAGRPKRASRSPKR